MDCKQLTLNDPPRFGGGTPLQCVSHRRSLVLWSGGVDSTYALVRLLRTTEDQIFSHHVRVHGSASQRYEFEHHAIARLRAWLTEHERGFIHAGSSVDFSELGGRGINSSILAFMAAQAAMTHSMTPFDRIVIGVNADVDPGWNPNSAACALRRARMACALRAAWGCDEVPQIYLCNPRPMRAQMIATLGTDLVALTASCSHPLVVQNDESDVSGQIDAELRFAPDSRPGRQDLNASFAPCGRCVKCRLSADSASPTRTQPTVTDGVIDAGEHGGAARKPHLFHHLEQLSNKKQALPHEVATSDPLVP